MEIEKLRYPIGKCNYDPNSAMIMKNTWTDTIKSFPEKLTNSVDGLSSQQLILPYRPDSWTIAQVIHHLADSHMHAYLRTKFTITEDHPKVSGYEEQIWADLPDAKDPDIAPSIQIITGVHKRWGDLFENMVGTDFKKNYHHLGYKKDFSLMHVLCLYAWHSNHHLAHIHQAIKYAGEFG